MSNPTATAADCREPNEIVATTKESRGNMAYPVPSTAPYTASAHWNSSDSANHFSEARSGVITLCVASVVLLVGMVVWLGIGPIDDTYIFLRYARNLADGAGAVFNLGERVEGYSSPLWMGLLGLLGFWFDLELASQVAGVVCCGTCIVLVICSQRSDLDSKGGLLRAIVGLSLAVSPVMFFASGSGMDTALFTVLVAASMLSALHDLPAGGLSWRTCFLLIATTAARSEGLMVAGFVASFFLLQRRRIGVLYLLAAVVLLGHFARYAYYGSWVPNTAYAKIAFPLSERVVRGWSYFADAWPVTAPLLAIAGIALATRNHVAQGSRHRLLFGAGWIGLYLTYVLYVGGDNIPGFRFLLPVIPAACLLILEIGSCVLPKFSIGMRHVALACLAGAAMLTNVATYQRTSKGYFANMELAGAWSKVGRWIDEHTPSSTVIATPVVGAIGYFGKRETIDMLGLTDSVVARSGRVYASGAHGHARYHTDYILERQPQFVIYMSSGRFTEAVYSTPDRIHKRTGFALFDFANDPRTQQRYRHETARLSDGTVIEMLARGPGDSVAAADNR